MLSIKNDVNDFDLAHIKVSDDTEKLRRQNFEKKRFVIQGDEDLYAEVNLFSNRFRGNEIISRIYTALSDYKEKPYKVKDTFYSNQHVDSFSSMEEVRNFLDAKEKEAKENCESFYFKDRFRVEINHDKNIERRLHPYYSKEVLYKKREDIERKIKYAEEREL